MKKIMERLEGLLEVGGTKKDIVMLVISGIVLLLSLTGHRCPLMPTGLQFCCVGHPYHSGGGH